MPVFAPMRQGGFAGMGIDEDAIRFGVFLFVFSIMALLEMMAPRRGGLRFRQRRWITNLALVVIDSLAVRVLIPITAVWAADFADKQGFGLFNQVPIPSFIAAVAAFVLLDFSIWLQHVVFHKVPVLWRLHAVHHADIGFDVTTGIRFHPVEILISTLWKIGVVLVLGAPAGVVFVFEVALNGFALFNHANVRIPRLLDAGLRLLVVTPDMHRVHHSVIPRETNSNFGFNLSFWDRLFGTYRAQPEAGHARMIIGLDDFQSDEPVRLGWSLLLPFRDLFSKRRNAPPK